MFVPIDRAPSARSRRSARRLLCASLVLVFSPGHVVLPGHVVAADIPSSSTTTLPITIVAEGNKLTVLAGTDIFCQVDHRSYEKPIVFPIYGPNQIPMTRSYPMVEGVAGEATDHPHHKSMWFGHGDLNKVSFWHGEGRIVTDEAAIVSPAEDEATPVIRLQNRLIGPDETVVATETQRISFGADESQRWIDWEIIVHATEGPLVFGDTKEGTAAIRVHPNLRLKNDPKNGVTTANGHALNSAGDQDGAVWGKRAAWVDYSGEVNGQPVGITILDHPQNLRHPTYWHARDYGLFAANPFGLSYFEGKDYDGTHEVAAGASLRLRYRLVFHQGKATAAQAEQMFARYRDAG